eukprot:tig00020564_g11450.t1
MASSSGANLHASGEKWQALSLKLHAAKAAKKASFEALAAAVGRSEVWVAAVFYGQAMPTDEEAKKLADALGVQLTPEEHALLTAFPARAELVPGIPSDPLIYRLYEIIKVYGYPLKSIILEKFGDGIMSAIDFNASVEKVPNPAGDRVRLTLEGKFLPFKKW